MLKMYEALAEEIVKLIAVRDPDLAELPRMVVRPVVHATLMNLPFVLPEGMEMEGLHDDVERCSVCRELAKVEETRQVAGQDAVICKPCFEQALEG